MVSLPGIESLPGRGADEWGRRRRGEPGRWPRRWRSEAFLSSHSPAATARHAISWQRSGSELQSWEFRAARRCIPVYSPFLRRLREGCLPPWNPGRGGRIDYPEAEIMDVDEALLREGRLSSRLHGYARIPRIQHLIQYPKGARPADDESMLDALGREIVDENGAWGNLPDRPGNHREAAGSGAGHRRGAVLGVDVLRDRRLVARDVTGTAALQLACGTPLRIIVGVTGGQGFVFGRGNQQIGAEAIRRCWPDAVTILAGSAKLALLPQPWLLADTGDQALDAALSGYVRVRTGPQRSTMMRIGLPSANAAAA